MTEKMSLLIFKETEHALGALTRTADPEGKLEAADVIGEGFPVIRDETTDEILLTVEADKLAVELIDRLDAVFAAPWRYAVVNGVAEPQADFTGGVITLSLTELNVELPANAPEEATVWMQVEGGPDRVRLVRSLKVPANRKKPTAPEPVDVQPGDYQVLVFAPGYAVRLSLETVP